MISEFFMGGYINYVTSAFKCGTSVGGEEMDKKIITVGRLNPHQWGQIVSSGGCYQQRAQDNRSEGNRYFRLESGREENGVILKAHRSLNAYPNGTCRTIKSQYIKNGTNNFTRTDHFGATGVIRKLKRPRIVEKKNKILCDLGVGGERGRVMSRKYCATAITATEYKDPQKVIKRFYERDRNKTGN